MGVVTYLGFVGVALAVAYGVRWLDPAGLDHLARRTGLSARTGWLVATVAVAWIFLPLLAGASADGGRLWLAGPAIAGVGCYLATIAAGSLDEHRLLARAEHLPPGEVTAGRETVVATSGVPEVSDGDAARTPFTGVPAVHTDWLVQHRRRLGIRETWGNLATGTTSVPFTLGGGAVAVVAGRHRTVSDAEHVLSFDPDDPLPEAAVEFTRERPDLPDPEDRENPIRIVETYVPADEPVTVVGVPRQGETPGRCVVDTAPPDRLLGTHGRGASRAKDGTGDERGEAVLVRGDAAAAATTLRRRVYWLGAASAAMIVGGQALAFALSTASLAALP